MSGEPADDAQKTEEPTPKRIEESRKKGQVALSREVNNWVMLFAGTLLIGGLLTPMMMTLAETFKFMLESAHDLPATPGGMKILLGGMLITVLKAMAFPLMLLMFAAFLSPFIQVGPLLAPEAIKPDWSKVSPIKGFERLFSKKALMEFGKGIIKIGMIGVIGVVILYPYFGQTEHFIGLPIQLLMKELQSLMILLMIGVLIVLLVIAVIDLVYQRADHHKKQRMTMQEVKDEYKQTEGDPHVKARLRQLRGEKARQRMMQAVPSADVVITNPTHYSIALKYDPETMEAPICVAKGIDDVALRIREVAKESGVEIFENKPLARSLYPLVEMDDVIPLEYYQAVAEVISYVFKRKGKMN